LSAARKRGRGQRENCKEQAETNKFKWNAILRTKVPHSTTSNAVPELRGWGDRSRCVPNRAMLFPEHGDFSVRRTGDGC